MKIMGLFQTNVREAVTHTAVCSEQKPHSLEHRGGHGRAAPFRMWQYVDAGTKAFLNDPRRLRKGWLRAVKQKGCWLTLPTPL